MSTVKTQDPNLPNSYIGRSLPRPNARALVAGRGRFTDDSSLPGLLHIAFVRSPHAHARITSIDPTAALTMPGVVRIVTARDLAPICDPWVGILTHFQGLKSPPQHPLAVERACWRGEAVAAVVAESRAEAEDAAEQVAVTWAELPAVTNVEDALKPGAALVHPELGSNLCFSLALDAGNTAAAFASAAVIVEQEFLCGRHTAVTLEPRGLIASWDATAGQLTVEHSTQSPYQMREIYARHLRLPLSAVRVIAPDIGGSFGMKLHIVGDEVATVAIAKLIGRPVKFIADRLESFLTDIHAREHKVTARLALDANGKILGMELNDVTAIGAYSAFPRTSAVEGNQVARLTPGAYDFANYRADLSVVFQNKVITSQYRGVGHPVAFVVMEGLMDKAAAALGIDPWQLRRKNVLPDDSYPRKAPSGYLFEGLSHEACLDRLKDLMGYDRLRAEQASLRQQGIYRGIGLCVFYEIGNPGPAFYGVGGAFISAQDGAVLSLDPDGSVRLAVSVTEQGQGTDTVMAQVAAEQLQIPMERIRVISGDTDTTPAGGATWASRGAGIGGEAVLQAGRRLKSNILALAASILQVKPADLDLAGGFVVDAKTRAERLSLAEVGRIGHYRPDTLPKDFQAELTATAHYVPRGYPFAFTNGVQASLVEVDIETGFVKLLDHWVVEDCGTMINPMLVDEQIRGGVVQGIGPALYEECLYDASGQLLNGSMAEYLVPMAAEMPDIHVGHVTTPTRDSVLGAKGVGECGTAGAHAAVINAINDAIAPLGGFVAQSPATPERVLAALDRAKA